MNQKKFRKQFHLFLIAFVVLASTFLAASQSSVFAQEGDMPPDLFSDVYLPAGFLPRATLSPENEPRSRFVRVNLDLLDTQEKSFTFNLFTDTVFTGTIERVKSYSEKNISKSGALTDQEGGYFSLVVYDSIFLGHIASPKGVYEVSWVQDDLYRVFEVKQDQLIDEPEDVKYAHSDYNIADASFGDSADDDSSVIDILVLYTDDARAAEGSAAAMNARITTAITETNDSYINSGITTSVNPVYTAEINYAEEGDIYKTKSRLVNPNDGYMDNIHALRNIYKADVVVLIIEDGGVDSKGNIICGLAATIGAKAKTAFAVVRRGPTSGPCMTGNYSFGHEIGHLQGARHDPYVDNLIIPYAYGHGYVFLPDRWRTVMAYNTKCAKTAPYTNCIRLQWWSNPNKDKDGDAMGKTGVSENYKVLNKTAYKVANFSNDLLPVPDAPKSNISDRTPEYTWTGVSGATEYQIQLKTGLTTIYKITVDSNACVDLTCSNTPSTELGYKTYKWRVQAKVDGDWESWSPYTTFKVISEGFNSTFDSDMSDWKIVNGNWSIYNSSNLWTPGKSGKFVSTYYNYNYSTLDYQVRMLRTGPCIGCANAVYVRGTPTPTWSSSVYWKSGYYFAYSNNGSYSVFKFKNSSYSALQNWTSTTAINQGGWNTLRVVAEGTSLEFYINDILVWNGSNSALTTGKVGIAMYHSTDDNLYVDWATLGTTNLSASLMEEQVNTGQVELEGNNEMGPSFAGPDAP